MYEYPTRSLKSAGIVAGFELRRSIAAPFALLAAALFAVFHTLVIRSTLLLTSAAAGVDKVSAGIVGWMTGLSAETVGTAFADHPPMLVGFFLLALVGTPILVVLAACDQLSTDVGSHHVRILLVRTARGPLYVGKALGALAFVTILQSAATVAAMIAALAVGIDSGEVLVFGPRILASLLIFSMPFVALMAFAGALLPHPALGLTCALGLQFMVWMMSTIGALVASGLSHLRFFYPTALRFQLVSDRASDLVPAFGHMLGLAAVFFLAGYLVFRSRNL